jgi:hypothetical protein
LVEELADVVRHELGQGLDAELSRDGCSRAGIVARQHDRLHTKSTEGRETRLGIRARLVADRNQAIFSLRLLLCHLNFTRLPALFKEHRQRTIEMQQYEPAFARCRLNPIAFLDGIGPYRAEINGRRTVGIRGGGRCREALTAGPWKPLRCLEHGAGLIVIHRRRPKFGGWSRCCSSTAPSARRSAARLQLGHRHRPPAAPRRHPLRKLQESGKPTPAQVSERLA